VVGASGAISGVMGAYLVLYPRIRIQTLFIFVIIFRIIPVPAWFVLILWFALQLLSGYADPVGTSGVAVWAHVGGFVAGLLLVKLFENRGLARARRRRNRVA
jgi:membrane associated rhomboid family serine protease